MLVSVVFLKFFFCGGGGDFCFLVRLDVIFFVGVC